MPSVDPKQVQGLIDRLKQLTEKAEAGKGTAATSAADVKSLSTSVLNVEGLVTDGKVDAEKWSALPEAEQLDRYEHLIRIFDATAVLLESDGPTDRSSVMFKEYLSNFWVIVLTLLALLGTIVTLYFIHDDFRWATERRPMADCCAAASGATGPKAASGAPGATGASGPTSAGGPTGANATGPTAATGPSGPSGPAGLNTNTGARLGPLEQDILLMVILMGTLGGFLHLTSSLAKYVGNRQLLRSWVIYYLLMPVEGPALAVVVYLLLRVGVLNASSTGQDTGNLNFVGIYGFSVLAGIFSKQALEMLANVFNTVFAKVQGKDSTTGGKPDSTNPPATGKPGTPAR